MRARAQTLGGICTAQVLVVDACERHARRIASAHSGDPEMRGLLHLGVTGWLARGSGVADGVVATTLGQPQDVAAMSMEMVDDLLAAVRDNRRLEALVDAVTAAAKVVPAYVPPERAAHVSIGGRA